jgi:L-aspartate oxidase
MWRQMGVERSRAGLEDALSKIRFWTRAVAHLDLSEPRGLELVNMLTVARLATLGALAREESRGTHFRTDHPAAREEWRAHTLVEPHVEDQSVVSADLRREPMRDPAPVA